MSLQIRRGTDAQRQAVTFDLGEILYTTDTKKLFIGDGATLGGVNVLASSAGTGLSWNSTTQTLNFSGTLSGYTTDNLAQGTVNLYYSPTRAKADIATMFTATGSATVTGTVTATTATTISFVGAVSTNSAQSEITHGAVESDSFHEEESSPAVDSTPFICPAIVENITRVVITEHSTNADLNDCEEAIISLSTDEMAVETVEESTILSETHNGKGTEDDVKSETGDMDEDGMVTQYDFQKEVYK
jgi:hypothetical protein